MSHRLCIWLCCAIFGGYVNSSGWLRVVLFSNTTHTLHGCFTGTRPVNSLRPRQNGRHFPNDIFLCIFLNENEWHSIKISLKFLPKVPINNIPAFVQIMAWRRPGDKPLSEPMMVRLPTHIYVTRPQWVKYICCEKTTSRNGKKQSSFYCDRV